jgi:hypothetical protein
MNEPDRHGFGMNAEEKRQIEVGRGDIELQSAAQMVIKLDGWVARLDFAKPTRVNANLTCKLPLRHPHSASRVFDAPTRNLLELANNRRSEFGAGGSGVMASPSKKIEARQSQRTHD